MTSPTRANHSLLEFEQKIWADGMLRVAGVDEAGRGPLAGPVVAAAVVFSRALLEAEAEGLFRDLNDSKQLTEKQRNHFFALLSDLPDIAIGIGIGDVPEIDAINILCATHAAMCRALRNLPQLPDFALLDGLPVPGLPCPSMAIVKGDSRSFSIAAASVIAKVTRDRLMRELDQQYPQYGFARHKGYGTSAHIQALLKYGPMPQHRHSFRPVHDIQAIRNRANHTWNHAVSEHI